jgi:uncharacterized iron-regulated membrane protein
MKVITRRTFMPSIGLVVAFAAKVGVPVTLVAYRNVGAVADGARAGAWDIELETAARFVEEAKASGEVARAIARAGLRGVSVAPAAAGK